MPEIVEIILSILFLMLCVFVLAIYGVFRLFADLLRDLLTTPEDLDDEPEDTDE